VGCSGASRRHLSVSVFVRAVPLFAQRFLGSRFLHSFYARGFSPGSFARAASTPPFSCAQVFAGRFAGGALRRASFAAEPAHSLQRPRAFLTTLQLF